MEMSLRHYFTFLGGQMCKYQYRFNQFQHSKYSDNINKSIPYRRIKLNYLHLKLLKKKMELEVHTRVIIQ